MSLYKRGDVWWYKFIFNGQVIRESAKTNSKTVATDAERVRRREIEKAYNHIPKRERVPLFSNAADVWLAGKTGLAPKSTERYEQCVPHLKEVFGNGLVCDIDANDVAEYQRKRLVAGVSNRTVNYEVGALRGILRQFGLWGPIADRVRALPERHDVGRALSAQDETRLIAAASTSRSPALLPLLLMSLDTGMRSSEVQALRHQDLKLAWANGNITSGEVIVPKSKTAAGTGRLIPFTRRVCACLSLWLSRSPEAGPGSFVFPFHQVGIGGNSRAVEVYDVDLSRPMGSWRKAWLGACKNAGVRYRWHDLRHTFVSRLAENANISEQTIRSLAGHVSRQMLEHYSHIRSQAKQAAIRCLEEQASTPVLGEAGHNIGHSRETANVQSADNLLKRNGGPARI
ncbi:MAG TPA: tyrosine-type recombinase/integrase [Candidatus Acidoferrum sp.]